MKRHTVVKKVKAPPAEGRLLWGKCNLKRGQRRNKESPFYETLEALTNK